jgi:hypothetical protein
VSGGLTLFLKWLLFALAVGTAIFLPRFARMFQTAARTLAGSSASPKTQRRLLFGLIGTYGMLLVLGILVLNR